MSAMDYRSLGQCTVCMKKGMLRQEPDGAQIVWEHWVDPCDPSSPQCPGGKKLPLAAASEGDAM
jgi:hypothetical protein